MKLYYSPGACSMAPHIVAHELGLNIEIVKVDLRSHTTEKGEDFYKIAPKGSVPALLLDSGELLTEGAVISQYLCSQKKDQKLLPPESDQRRFKILEWLNFTTSELHKTYSVFFSAPRDFADESVRSLVIEKAKTNLFKKLDHVEKSLAANGPYLTGPEFSPADAYLFTVLSWSKSVRIELSAYPKIMGFLEMVSLRPAVQATRAKEKGR
jgi:glutathione S-transferase